VNAVEHVGDLARPLLDRVHGCDLSHALAVRFSPLVNRVSSVGALLPRLARCLAQITMQRRDALGVEAQHQQVLGVLRSAEPVAIELVEVARRAHRKLLDLALRHLCAALLRDQLDDLVERRSRCLLSDDPPDLVRVLLLRQLHAASSGASPSVPGAW